MKRIIVCDDEPHVTEGLRHLLRSPDRFIEVASSAREALRSIEQATPDLLITDIMMPEMSGLELVAQVRAEARTRDMPILILTAKGQAADATLAEEMWGATVMAKPFEPRRLKDYVTTILEKSTCPANDCVSQAPNR